jgi:uncharacterized pyridoxal phosphate-containing UPF0001 family protein
MGIAEDTAETQRIVSQFNSLASLRNTLAQQLDLSITSAQAEATTPHTLAELSMGMSGDWKLAVAAGATLIRIGSAVFGQRA